MFDSLFGAESLVLRAIIALPFVLALIAGLAWLVRRFGADRLGANAARGRQPRLAVIDAAAVDSRRRLLLIRRDNVEHLLMIGGPTDVVVEQNIIRAVSARDNAPAGRGPGDTLPRAVSLPESANWPLQPEPAPVVSPAPVSRGGRAPLIDEPAAWTVPDEEPAPAISAPIPPRPARAEPRMAEPKVAEPRLTEPRTPEPRIPEPRQPEARPFDPRLDARQVDTRQVEARQIEPRPTETRQAEPRRAEPRGGADTLAGLAEELSRQPAAREPAREPVRPMPSPLVSAPEPVRAPSPVASAAPAPVVTAEAPPVESNDQNLADMAQRLEAALRRPMTEALKADAPKAEAPAIEPVVASEPVVPKPAPVLRAEPMRPTAPAPAPFVAKAPIAPPVAPPVAEPAPRAEVKAAAQPANFYDSLEQEMASLLGRPQNKG